MNQKFSFRAIQQGQTQQSQIVSSGAGQNGQALVVRAAEGTRYQIADLLTLTSPKKLLLKRAGQDLLVALPGNDVASPDIVIKDYFNFKDLSLSGLAASGEPMVYDTGITLESLAADKTTAATLATASGAWLDSGWGLAALGGGGLLLAAASGSSSASDSTATNASLTKITAYKVDATKAVPSVTDFSSAGVSGVDAGNITGILSLFPRTQLPLDSAASLQTLVDSFRRVVAEANGTVADGTTEDPTSTDYTNLMGASTPNSLITKPQALALLNDRVKALNTTEVDSYAEFKALADAVEVVSVLAQSAASTTGTATAGITAAQLTTLGVDVVASSLSAVSDAIRASADDLSGLYSTAKLAALVKAYNTILAEANGTAADATVANPTAADYAAIGADIGAAKTDATALTRLNAIVGNAASTAVDTVDEINKLAATLDKLQTVAALAIGTTLTDAQKFSGDELKNLGLTGFTGTEIQNTALALKVSEAIKDKELADVAAGTFTKSKLKSDGTLEDWPQTQLERLQTLVSQEIVKNYQAQSTGSTSITPTLLDWQNIGVFTPKTLKATTADSAAQGYTALTATELALLNSAADTLAGSDFGANADTSGAVQAKAQAVLEAYMRIMQEANGSASDANVSLNPTAADLKAVGVTGDVTDASKPAARLMLDAIANLASTGVDTVPELQALAGTATKLMAEAAKAEAANAGTFTLAELASLGLRGAAASGASSNDGDFLKLVRANADDGSGVDTLAKLQALLSLSVVQAWARDVNPNVTASPAIAKTAATPSAQDYKDMGVTRDVPKKSDGSAGDAIATLSQADTTALNDAIDTLVDSATPATGDAVNSLEKVKAIAASYFKILNEANGSASNYTAGNTIQNTDGTSTAHDAVDLNVNPVALDYTNIGVVGTFTDTRTSLLNTLIAEKTFAQVDTVKEIQALASSVDKLLALAGATGTEPSLTAGELGTDLGLLGVNDKNLADINAAIKATALVTSVDSFAELQSLVSLARIQRYADSSNTSTGAANEGGALPTSATGSYADDWKNLLGVEGELSANYSAYNSAVDAMAKSDFTGTNALANLQSLVNGYNAILAQANGSAADATPSADPTTTDFTAIGFASAGFWTGAAASNSVNALKLLNEAIKTLTTDKVDTVDEIRSLITAVNKVIDLAGVTSAATENTTNNTGSVTGLANNAGLTMADLKLLGLASTDKALDTNGGMYLNEAPNVLAAIQNADPSSITFDAIQTIINARVI